MTNDIKTNTLFPELEPSEKEVKLEKIRQLAVEFYEKNSLKNKIIKEEEAAREELLALMDEEGLDILSMEYDSEKKLVASITTPTKDTIDVYKLRNIIGDEDLFMKTISATKKSVEDFCGKSIIKNITNTVIGTRNVSVKLSK